jgi:hypothetical protein
MKTNCPRKESTAAANRILAYVPERYKYTTLANT